VNLLILGGTVFLGRHVVEAALVAGHDVTLFNRGHHPEVFPDVERLIGDRDGDLRALQGRTWDAVVDTSGYVPRIVRASAGMLAGGIGLYTFVSTISVFPDLALPDLDEQAPVASLPDCRAEEITPERYGPLKALCEQAVEAVLPGRALILRPGLIVGPHDPTDRFTYWPRRLAQGGEVLAPGRPAARLQFIDVRDLAAWTVRLIEAGGTGTFNATGPTKKLHMEALLAACQTASGGGAWLTWVPDAFLLEQGLVPWSEVPLWIPGVDMTINCAKAWGAGLTTRPLADTIRDTLAWDRTRPAGVTHAAGLAPEREHAVLAAWHARQGR
jgi:2'-hydroxyisoflavone reductase